MPFWKSYHGRMRLLLVFILLVQVYNAIQWRQSQVTNFGCEICADKVGYYIYLPIWFNYGLEQKDMPQTIREKCHQDFQNPLAPGKNFTKFTCGSALMLSPFYVVGDLWYRYFDLKDPLPLSNEYLQFTNFGTALYVTLALLALLSLLKKRYGLEAALLTLLSLYFLTNLRYYIEDESLMSHVYSFCQFAFAWFFFDRALSTRNKLWLMLFALSSSWAILIRPSNLFGIPVIVLASFNEQNWKEELRFIFRYVLWMIPVAFIPWIPQFLYWKMTTGTWLVYSYQDEGFHRWKAPAIREQWFAVQSGVIAYTPGVLLIPFGIGMMIRKNQRSAWILMVSLLFSSYLFASWWVKGFGDCNFGYRPFVEFSALWSPAIAFFYLKLSKTKPNVQVLVGALIISAAWYTNHLYWNFDSCFFGDPWDYQKFIQDYFIPKGA
ncbi:MAG: hypothetical protein LPK45_12055 [Bacteroidota bacterium]|nr:hypothetical protein [Bacteroidota bacterium]MDX5431846.1 hypothetical protein [Bacteroidota bacterium]MDX5470557.1 hypothetical protein [Bacteroidota bacterium]